MGALRWWVQWFGAGALGPSARTLVLLGSLLPWLVLRAWRPAWECVLVALALGTPALAVRVEGVPAGATAAALLLALAPTRPTALGLTVAVLGVGCLVHVRPAPVLRLEARFGPAAADLACGALLAGSLAGARLAGLAV